MTLCLRGVSAWLVVMLAVSGCVRWPGIDTGEHRNSVGMRPTYVPGADWTVTNAFGTGKSQSLVIPQGGTATTQGTGTRLAGPSRTGNRAEPPPDPEPAPLTRPGPYLFTNAPALVTARPGITLSWDYKPDWWTNALAETFEVWATESPDLVGGWHLVLATNRGPAGFATDLPLRVFRVRAVSADGTTFSGGTVNTWPITAQ